ncbi:ferritin-like domain-containing protein [Gloeopeniophorella convolvens]|nr:ferritin-like domain-containing protein [Gloeopeniophorella convolvens]
MKFTASLLPFSILAAVAHGRPIPRDISDTDVLNFALTLEHLENAFYSEGLSKFTQQDFIDAGLADWSYGRIKQIAAHEAEHVQFLQEALGDKATKPCTYSFPYTDPKSFVTLSHALETVGDSAYIGASRFVQSKDTLVAAATILSVEARHSAWLDSAVRKGSPWSSSFDTPLDPDQAFTLASSFITSCPSDNPKLPATAFAALTLPDPASAMPGSTTPLHFALPDGFDRSTKLYGAFLSGQNAVVVPLGDDLSVSIPGELRGVVYLLVTTDADGVADDKTIAGPALLEFSFNSNGDFEILPF